MIFLAGKLLGECGGATTHAAPSTGNTSRAALRCCRLTMIVNKHDGIAPQLTLLAKVQFVGPRGGLHAVRGEWDNDRRGEKTGESRGGCR
jgi:hypothetical protein